MNSKVEFEKLQNGEISLYWESVIKDPSLIKSWKELSLLNLASAWSGIDLPGKNDNCWINLFKQMSFWTDDFEYIMPALQTISDHVFWNKEKANTLLKSLYKINFNEWESLLLLSNANNNSLSYHCIYFLNVNNELLSNNSIMKSYLNIITSTKLVSSLKEHFLIDFLSYPPYILKNSTTFFEEKNVHLIEKDGLIGFTYDGKFLEFLQNSFPSKRDFFEQLKSISYNLSNNEYLFESLNILAEHLKKSVVPDQWREDNKIYSLFDAIESLNF